MGWGGGVCVADTLRYWPLATDCVFFFCVRYSPCEILSPVASRKSDHQSEFLNRPTELCSQMIACLQNVLGWREGGSVPLKHILNELNGQDLVS